MCEGERESRGEREREGGGERERWAERPRDDASVLTWLDGAVVPRYGRGVGVAPGPVFVLIWVPAVGFLHVHRRHAPVTDGPTHKHTHKRTQTHTHTRGNSHKHTHTLCIVILRSFLTDEPPP